MDAIDLLIANVATLKAQSSASQHAETRHQNRDRSKEPYGDDNDVDCPWWMKNKEPYGDDNDVDCPWSMKNPSSRPHTKMGFPKFEGEDPRGWILK